MITYFKQIGILFFITTSLLANPFCDLFQSFKKNRLYKKTVIEEEALFITELNSLSHDEIFKKYLIDEDLMKRRPMNFKEKHRKKSWNSGMKLYKKKLKLAIEEEEREFLLKLNEFVDKGQIKQFLEHLDSKNHSDLLSPHYKRSKLIARKNSLKQKKVLTKLVIENHEKEFAKTLVDMDLNQKLDIFWGQKKTSFSLFSPGHPLYTKTTKARIQTWMAVLDHMGPTDYMKRFWREFKSADSAFQKMKRVVISKHSPNRLVKESLGGLLVGKDPTAVASEGNFLFFPFKIKDSINFYLTRKILRQPGKKVDLQNVFRKVTERVLLKKGDHFTFTTKIVGGTALSLYTYPYFYNAASGLMDAIWIRASVNNYLEEINEKYMYAGIKSKLEKAKQDPKGSSYTKLDAANEAHVLNEAHVGMIRILNENKLIEFEYSSPREKLKKYFGQVLLGPILEPLLEFMPEDSLTEIKKIPRSLKNDKRRLLVDKWLDGLSEENIKKLNNLVRTLEMKMELWQSIPMFFEKDFDHQKFKNEKLNFTKKLKPEIEVLLEKNQLSGEDKRLLSQLRRADAMYTFYEHIFGNDEDKKLKALSYQDTSEYKRSKKLTEKLAEKIINTGNEDGAHYYLDLVEYRKKGMLSEKEFIYRIHEDISRQAERGYEQISKGENSDYPALDHLQWKSRIEIEALSSQRPGPFK